MSKFVELDKNKILKLRRKFCWSQDELAAASGLSIRTIQRVEKSGNASLETVKALASVLEVEPGYIQQQNDLPNLTFSFIFKYGWLMLLFASCLLFGSWVVDILIPTLKGASFNHQYEIHGNFRYLDYGGVSFAAGFVWLGVYLFVQHVGLASAVKANDLLSSANAKTDSEQSF